MCTPPLSPGKQHYKQLRDESIIHDHVLRENRPQREQRASLRMKNYFSLVADLGALQGVFTVVLLRVPYLLRSVRAP